jgi:hypothetical protein
MAQRNAASNKFDGGSFFSPVRGNFQKSKWRIPAVIFWLDEENMHEP